MTTKNSDSLGAAIIFAALFFISSPGLCSQPKTETAADIIEKSYTLSLQKERTQAVVLLVNAIKKETKKSPKASKDLLKALDRVASVFYSDKAQQLYELGISLKMSDPGLALQKISEALKIESDNQEIILAHARAMMATGDCSGALSQAKKTREANPYSEEVTLVASQAAVCSGQFETYLQLRAGLDEKHSPYAPFWTTVEVEYQFRSDRFERALELSRGLEKSESSFPEGYFWQWRILTEQKQPAQDIAAKYINLCKALSARAQRQFNLDPNLCRKTSEVESFLKKNNNQNL